MVCEWDGDCAKMRQREREHRYSVGVREYVREKMEEAFARRERQKRS